jgi:hypothetical protein
MTRPTPCSLLPEDVPKHSTTKAHIITSGRNQAQHYEVSYSKRRLNKLRSFFILEIDRDQWSDPSCTRLTPRGNGMHS